MVALALARLDPVYRQVPGVYASWQLQPLALEARYELPWVWRGLRNETVEGEQRANRREARNVGDLTAALEPLSEDVVVHGWREGSSRTVAVGVAEVEQDAARLAEELLDALPRATTRAWAVGDRFVVALTVTAPGGPERSALADERAEQVGASVAVARVLWWEAISLGPFLLVLLLAGAVLIAWFLLYAIFQLLKVVVFLLVLLPLTLLGLREPRPSLPPAAQDDALRALAPGVVPVDLDELQLPSVPGAVAWFTALVLALAVAIPALATSLWTASLVWGALGAALALVWWGRGRNDPWARAARWAVAAAAALELANALFGLGPGLPADGPLALAAAAALLAGAVALAWRRTALSDRCPAMCRGTRTSTLARSPTSPASRGSPLPAARSSSARTATSSCPRSSSARGWLWPAWPWCRSSAGGCARPARRRDASGRETARCRRCSSFALSSTMGSRCRAGGRTGAASSS
jgi:hypothetical protein